MRTFILCFAIYLFASLNTFSQMPPGVLSKNQADLFKHHEKPDSAYSISHDTLLYASSIGSILQAVVLFNPVLKERVPLKNCKYSFQFELNIDSCYFKNDDKFPAFEECGFNFIGIEFKRGFSVTNSEFSDELGIQFVNNNSRDLGTTNIKENKARDIYLGGSEFGPLNIQDNEVTDMINIDHVKSRVAFIAFNKFKNSSGNIRIYHSNFLSGITIFDNSTINNNFEGDTINGDFEIFLMGKPDSAYFKPVQQIIYIRDSYINARCLFVADSLCTSKLIFENCSFGSSSNIFNLKVDSLIFKNCTDIPYPLFLTADSSKEVIYLELINSNVNNIRFDYTDKFRLFFDSGITEETKNNTYQSLLAKYKSEGKPENIEKIDIEYKRYEYKKNRLMYPIWLLDYIWWRYGYSKWLIILWNLFFIRFFFNFNYRNWEGMRKTYGAFDKEDLSYDKNNKKEYNRTKKILSVLIFTSFIFFSPIVDFDKIKYSNNKYVAWFFTQYIVGIVCFFFIVNFILKI